MNCVLHPHYKDKVPGACFAVADSSSHGFLKVSSKSGDIDAYIGDNGSADLHSQEGKQIGQYTIYLEAFNRFHDWRQQSEQDHKYCIQWRVRQTSVCLRP